MMARHGSQRESQQDGNQDFEAAPSAIPEKADPHMAAQPFIRLPVRHPVRFLKGIVLLIGSSLKLKLILSVVGIVGLALGSAPWSTVKMQERQLLLDAQEHLESVQTLLKTVVAANMLIGNREDIQRLIEMVGSKEDIKLVRIFDTDGVIHFSSNPDERGNHVGATELPRYRGATDPVILSTERGVVTHTLLQPMFNEPACHSCHPPEQKVLGILQISLSLDETWRRIAGLRRSALWATLIALAVIIGGISLSFTLFIGQPLDRLVAVMAQAERGDLGARSKADRGDEIGRLAGHFNEMVSKLDIAHQELERYHHEQLARADRLATIGEMAAAIAHEIRNPLTGISGVLSVLSRDFPGDDPRREVVRQSHLLIDRLNKSVEDILHYSRPSLPHFQPVDLGSVIKQSLSLVEGEARKARVRVVNQTTSGQGSDAESPIVNADPQQILQVSINLVLNALQATAAGGEVFVRTDVVDNHGGERRVRIEITDNGKGMTAEEVAKAFHPFFSTKAQGTGLGLAIAKQIVEQHHGVIALYSTPGQGTRVRVELPAHQPPAERGSAESGSAESGSAESGSAESDKT